VQLSSNLPTVKLSRRLKLLTIQRAGTPRIPIRQSPIEQLMGLTLLHSKNLALKDFQLVSNLKAKAKTRIRNFQMQ
jgi:hypothetical protein